MTNEEAIKFAKEQTHIFGGTMKEFLQFVIDKLERPQGEWIRTGSLGNGNARYECSNCHRGDVQAESQEVPYCWHCGAKMQKGGAENDS